MNTLNEENKILRSVLIRLKNLPPKTTLSEVQLIVSNAVKDLPYRDPITGEEYYCESGRTRKNEDKAGDERYGN